MRGGKSGRTKFRKTTFQRNTTNNDRNVDLRSVSMATKIAAAVIVFGFLGSVSVVSPSSLMAQAPPGPIAPPQQSQGSPAPPRPAARPQQEEPVQPRTTIAGAWKLNVDESDDPRRTLQDSQRTSGGNSGGYPGGGYPGGGYPGGYPGGGFPFPGGGAGTNGRRGGQNAGSDQGLEQLIRRPNAVSVVLKDAEVDVTDDESRELIFYTDGRKLQKSADESRQEIAAHWNGSRLMSDEKSPQGGKMSRTFELSGDGRQLDETLRIDNPRSRAPLEVRYVFDIFRSDAHSQTGPDSDPNRPVLRRLPDADNNSSQ